MRIGIYDPYLDDMGGGEKYMLKIAECLSDTNEVVLFWDKKEDLDIVLSRFSIDLSRVKLVPNIFGRNFPLTKRLLESRKYDALIILSDGSIPFVLSKKLFIHIQQPMLGRKKSLKIDIKLKRVRKVFCNSYYTSEFVNKSYGIKSHVIYPPVDLHPKRAEKENIILHVGRFRVVNPAGGDYKKQSVMVDAFGKMVKKGLKKWKLVIAVGVKDEDRSEFDFLLKSSKNYPVEFVVNLSNADLWEYYSKAKIYWHASGFGEDLEKHPEFAEHFGISTVEAMGAGAVPIVINAGGQKEIVEDNVSGFLWNNLKELEEKTFLLTREDKILKSMSQEAARRAKDFAGDRFCEEIRRVIEV